jgi:hypothetical protein
MRIERYPLTDNYYIIVFEGRKNVKYTRGTSSSWIVEGGNSVSTCFSNARFDLTGIQLLGKILNTEESKFAKIIEESGFVTNGNPKQALINFLSAQGFEITENTHLMCPKFTKKLTGKKIPIQFDLGNPNFDYGEHEYKDLDVYMTPITNTTKSVKFSVVIPTHIYNKCMTDPNEDLRPKYRHIESESLSYLHSAISSLANQAFNLYQREKDAASAKKVICINFNSSEHTERDSYNFGYVGQKMNTTFSYYVCYFTGKEYYTYFRVDSGTGLRTTGVPGVLDNTISGHKSWIKQSPKVMIDWTQEREDFLIALESNFRKLSENLNKFLKDLDSDKLDLLVANSELLKLN